MFADLDLMLARDRKEEMIREVRANRLARKLASRAKRESRAGRLPKEPSLQPATSERR